MRYQWIRQTYCCVNRRFHQVKSLDPLPHHSLHYLHYYQANHNNYRNLLDNYNHRTYCHKRNRIRMNIDMSYDSSLCSLIPKICTLGTVYTLPLWRSLKIACLLMTCSSFPCFIRKFCPDESLFYTSGNNFSSILGNSAPLFLNRTQRRWYTQEWDTKSYL